jgi:hypothetical protein
MSKVQRTKLHPVRILITSCLYGLSELLRLLSFAVAWQCSQLGIMYNAMQHLQSQKADVDYDNMDVRSPTSTILDHSHNDVQLCGNISQQSNSHVVWAYWLATAIALALQNSSGGELSHSLVNQSNRFNYAPLCKHRYPVWTSRQNHNAHTT